MKNRVSILVVLMLTAMIAPAFASIPLEGNHPSRALWVQPRVNGFYTDTTHPGDRFTVIVAMNFTENVYAYQVKMRYNTAQLSLVSYYYTGNPAGTISEYFKNDSRATTTSSSTGAGYLVVFETCTGTDFVAGPRAATLFNVTFQILQTAVPGKGGNTTSTLDISTDYGTLTYVVLDDGSYPSFSHYDGYFWYAWAPPTTHPNMGIEPVSYFGVAPSSSLTWPLTYGPSPPNVTGSGFTANLTIKNLDPAWGLWNASFTLTYNCTVISVVGGVANVTLDPHWTAPGIPVNVTEAGGVGTIDIYVENYSPAPPGDPVGVATVEFTVMLMDKVPPRSSGYYDKSLLTYSNVKFFDAPSPNGDTEITPGTSEHGEVDVYAMIALPRPYLKVVPASTTLGPAPVIGTTFNVSIQVVNMSSHWYDVAVQFRLQFDSSVIDVANVYEGKFLTDPKWDKYGTSWPVWSMVFYGDPVWGDFLAMFDMIYPNMTSGNYDQPYLPNTLGDYGAKAATDPTVAIVTFRVVAQNCFDLPDINTFLNIPPFWLPTDKMFIDQDAGYIPSADCKNGTVTIRSLNEVNRVLDLFGGAEDDGYGGLVALPTPYGYSGYGLYTQFPATYGGQGQDIPMDLVFPQSQVYLNAYLTYNYWPVQMKDVGFEIEGPYEHILNQSGSFYVKRPCWQVWAKFTATTDVNGVATYTYRMPWPCDNPDAITGVWKITATATVADQVVMDTMMFYYERVVYITKVTTDSYGYYHDTNVVVTVDYESHSMRKYWVLFSTVITDNLTVPIGMALYNIKVGGATFCSWKTGEFEVSIFIPKWAYAGNGAVHVTAFDKDPTVGGEAYTPEYTPDPVINIYPYNTPLQFYPSTGIASDDSALGEVPPGESGYVSTWWSYWPGTNDLCVIYEDEIDFAAIAIGGYPTIGPGYIPLYTYEWYVNGTLYSTDALVRDSTFSVIAGVAPLDPLTYPTTYRIDCVVTDKLGTTATSTLYVYVHYGDIPGP